MGVLMRPLLLEALQFWTLHLKHVDMTQRWPTCGQTPFKRAISVALQSSLQPRVSAAHCPHLSAIVGKVCRSVTLVSRKAILRLEVLWYLQDEMQSIVSQPQT